MEKKQKGGWLIASGVGLGLLVWESLFTAIMALSVIVVMSWQSLRVDYKKYLVMGVVVLFIAWPVIKVYYEVSRENMFTRSIRDAAHNGLSVDDLGKRFYSPGLFMLLGMSMWLIWKKKIVLRDLSWLFGVMLVGLVLSFGPVLKWDEKTVKIAGKIPIPMPYAMAYYGVPGFKAFRTPSRWIWMTAWAGSGLVAIGISRIRRQTLVTMAALLGVAIVGGSRMGTTKELKSFIEIPAVYRWLSTQPEQVVLELPMGDENIEAERMYYSLFHGKKLLNGYSGFYPAENIELKNKVENEASGEMLVKEFDRREVDYLIVHKQFFNQTQLSFWETVGGEDKVWENEEVRVYGLWLNKL